MARKLEETGRLVGAELGRSVRRLEKEAEKAARRARKMQKETRVQSATLLRRTARQLNRIAKKLDVAGSRPRKPATRRRTAKKSR